MFNRNISFRQITVVLGVFISFLLCNGALMTMGVYMVPILEEFDVGSAVAGWICSLAFAVMCMAGPVASIIVNKIHCRWVVMAGGAIQSFGMMMAYFATSTTTLFITLGIVTGFGASLVFISQTVILTTHFTTYSTTVIGIGFTGIASGIFVLPPLINFLISTYGWRSATLIEGAIMLHIVAIGANYQQKPNEMPPSNPKKVGSTKADETLQQSQEVRTTQLCFISSRWIPSHIILLKDTPIVILVYLASFCVNLAFTATLVHSSNQITSSGYSKQNAAFVLSLLGIGNIIGRLVQGIVVDFFKISPMILYETALILAAVATCINPIVNNYVGFMISAFGTGLSAGILFTVFYVIIIQLVGTTQLATATGMELFADCMGIMFGGYLAGAIRDNTGSYITGFYVFGVTYILGALFFIPILYADWRKRTWLLVQNTHGLEEDQIESCEV